MTPHAFGVRSIRVASRISLKMLTRDAISRQNLRVASEPYRECKLSPGLPADTDVAVRAHGLAPDRYIAYRFWSSLILSTCPAEYCGAGRLDQWGVSDWKPSLRVITFRPEQQGFSPPDFGAA